MAITLVSDPIMDVSDARQFFNLKNEARLALLVNSLTEKFKRFTGRVQLSEDQSTDIVEYVRSCNGYVLYLHCSPFWSLDTNGIAIAITEGHETLNTYSYSDNDFTAYSDNTEARIEATSSMFPLLTSAAIAKVTYRGGWTTIPGDVIEGAVIQGRVDLRRLEGEAGVTQRGLDGESTTYESVGLVKAVREIWSRYRIID